MLETNFAQLEPHAVAYCSVQLAPSLDCAICLVGFVSQIHYHPLRPQHQLHQFQAHVRRQLHSLVRRLRLSHLDVSISQVATIARVGLQSVTYYSVQLAHILESATWYVDIVRQVQQQVIRPLRALAPRFQPHSGVRGLRRYPHLDASMLQMIIVWEGPDFVMHFSVQHASYPDSVTWCVDFVSQVKSEP